MSASNITPSFSHLLNRSLNLQTIAEIHNVYNNCYFFDYYQIIFMFEIVYDTLDLYRFGWYYKLNAKFTTFLLSTFFRVLVDDLIIFFVASWWYNDWNKKRQVFMLVLYSRFLTKIIGYISMITNVFNKEIIRTQAGYQEIYKYDLLSLIIFLTSCLQIFIYLYSIFRLLRNNMRIRQTKKTDQATKVNQITVNLLISSEDEI